MNTGPSPSLSSSEPCQISIDLLRERTEKYLRQNGAMVIWFADHDEVFPVVPAGEVVDVVLFGNFLRRFLESGNWTASSVRVWVLSSAVRDVCVKLLGLAEDAVGVIPRYVLFTPDNAGSAFPGGSDPFTWVYSGRIAPTKNIEMLLRTASFAQTSESLPLRLAFFGDFEDERYREAMLKVSRDLPWTEAPRFFGKLGPWEWLEADLENPVLTSFSTFVCEDYDVSLAQAQGAAWPALVSNWGGHRDATGENVIKIPHLLIGNSHEPSWLITLKARVLAHWIVKKMRSERHLAAIDRENIGAFPYVSPMMINDLDQLRRQSICRIGKEFHWFYRGVPGSFAMSTAGERFFEEYSEIFGGPYSEPATVILVNDLSDAVNPVTRNIETIAEAAVPLLLKRGENVVFILVRDIGKAHAMRALTSAQRIIVPFYSEQLPLLVSSWRRGLGIRASLRIFGGKNQDLIGLDRLHQVLRPQDRVTVFEGSLKDGDL